MGHRQLALIFALISALFALLLTAICMMLQIPAGIPVIISVVLFNVTSIVQMSIAKKKWELDYKNAFMMLLATSIPCAIVYTFGFKFLETMFDGYLREGPTQFFPFFFGCILFRLPIDAIVAIFHKK